MTQYRKKPVTIKAIQWNPRDGGPASETVSNYHNTSDFLAENNCRQAYELTYFIFRLRTLENDANNWHVASPGDWLICGVQGEFYFCKPDVFAATYEPVEESLSPIVSPTERDYE